MPLFRALAVKFKIVDYPGERKVHHQVTPLLGGVAIYVGLLVGLSLYGVDCFKLWYLLSAATLVMAVGLIDDARGLSARFRLFAQIVAALIVVMFGDRINCLPKSWWGDLLEIIISVVWIVGITNGYNYLDGLDGLAGGSAAINLISFALILHVTDQPYLTHLSIILAGTCLAFLPHNLGKKKIFLGDAGSTFIGFILASIGLLGYWAEGSIVKISIPILILGVPIFDMIFTTFMRIREKKVSTIQQWLEYGGRDHFHHYLVDLGLMSFGSVVFIYFVSISLGLSALIIKESTTLIALLSIFQAALLFGMVAILMVMGRHYHSNQNSHGHQ